MKKIVLFPLMISLLVGCEMTALSKPSSSMMSNIVTNQVPSSSSLKEDSSIKDSLSNIMNSSLSSTSTSLSTNKDSNENYDNPYYTGYDLNLSDNSLLIELRGLLQDTHKKITTYDELRQSLQLSDISLIDSSKILQFYSRKEVNKTWQSGETWNREHVWPQANGWFKTSGAGSDMHHIRPTMNKVNSTRGNKPFGEVSNGSQIEGCTYSSSYFEPQDAAKGDTARIIFYLLTRYSEADSYSITKVAQSMSMLLEWNELDPVDEWEKNRNEETYKYQGNRNPFIDYPSLANSIWG